MVSKGILKYADGLIEQWGNNSNQSDKNNYPLAVAYSNTDYWVFYLPQTSSTSDDNGDANDWWVKTKTVSSFTGDSSANNGGYWSTKGY